MRWAVVIPALDEASRVAAAVASAQAAGAREVWVVDGGSRDGTPSRAADAGARVLQAPRGRAAQMNAGAAAAQADALLFLHADTVLPPDALRVAAAALRDGAAGGVFRLRFDTPSPLLRLYAAATWLPWGRLAFGDRALFCSREAFGRAGGFPPVAAFEDLELVRRLRRAGRFAFVPLEVTTSARRFVRNGTLAQQLRNLCLWIRYVRGGDPDRLAAAYGYGAERGD